MTKQLFPSIFTLFSLTINSLLGGCAAIDSAVDKRSHTVNVASGDYSSVAILTNIVRAKNYEPLNFVSLTGFTGHDTFSSALPAIGIIPSPTSVSVDNNTASSVFSNDFNVSVLDDPGSYAALLEPINPALMGLFIKAGYPRELIYLLFFDYIRIKDQDGIEVYKNFPEPTVSDQINRREGRYQWVQCGTAKADQETKPGTFNKTVCKIESLIKQGLTIEIDSDFQPSSAAIPSYKFCFDPHLPVPVQHDPPEYGVYGYFDNEPGRAFPQCESPSMSNVTTKWTIPESSDPTMTINVDAPSSADVGKQLSVIRRPRASYTVLDTNKQIIEIHTRSVLGAYQYLGQILHYQFDQIHLRYADTADSTLLLPLSRDDGDCFTSIVNDGQTYCIPKSAANTKRIFSLLRQLTGLLTKPNNQPATETTRSTPSGSKSGG